LEYIVKEENSFYFMDSKKVCTISFVVFVHVSLSLIRNGYVGVYIIWFI
jgi:hypothetical protein